MSTPIEGFQQKSNAEKGYIVTKNNEYKSGFIEVRKIRGNVDYILYYEFIRGNPVKHDKGTIKEFGINDNVYVLLPINNDEFFVQRLNNKEPYLYFCKTKEGREFYYLKENKLVPLPKDKDKLTEEIQIISKDCNEVKELINNINYNKNRLSAFYARLGECSNKKIPYFKAGVFASAQLHKFNLSGDNYFTFTAVELGGQHNLHVTQENLKTRFNSSYGVFLDIPVFRNNMNFTLHPEFEFSTGKYEFEEDVATVIIDLNYLNTSLLLRYNNQAHKKSLFFDIGVTYSYLMLNDVHVEFQGNNYSAEYSFAHMYGLGFGMGMEYSVFKRNTLNFGIKGNYLTSFYQNPAVWNIAPFIAFAF